jgi:soluble lytic murein transglycosylase-like protein
MGTKPRKGRKNRVLLWLTLLIFGGLLVGQVIAYRNQATEWKTKAEKKPKVIEKVKVKKETKIRWKTKKIYIYRGKTNKWKPLVQKYFGNQTQNALRVMACESGGNPSASSHTDDHGLMQINAPTWCSFFGVSRQELQDPETNVKLASIIYQRSGWRAWTCARKLGVN